MYRRRRRKNNQPAETNPPWPQLNVNPYRRFSEHHTASQSNSRIGQTSDATIIPINQPENPFLTRRQGPIRTAHSSGNSSERSCQLQLSMVQDSTDSSIDSPSPVNMTPVHRLPKSSIETRRYFTSSKSTRRNQTVSVSRVKRSLSANNRVGSRPIKKTDFKWPESFHNKIHELS